MIHMCHGCALAVAFVQILRSNQSTGNDLVHQAMSYQCWCTQSNQSLVGYLVPAFSVTFWL